jgi:hypothetical protein
MSDTRSVDREAAVPTTGIKRKRASVRIRGPPQMASDPQKSIRRQGIAVHKQRAPAEGPYKEIPHR